MTYRRNGKETLGRGRRRIDLEEEDSVTEIEDKVGPVDNKT